MSVNLHIYALLEKPSNLLIKRKLNRKDVLAALILLRALSLGTGQTAVYTLL